MEVDVEKAQLAAKAAALDAGWLITQVARGPLGVRVKDTADTAGRDLVTDADNASETLIRKHLSAAFPNFAFIGEESAKQGTAVDPDRPTWVVDPLDGTVNYSCGFVEQVCVMIGLCHRGKVLLGVVHSPWLKQLYVGVDGRASTLNDRPIRVSDAADPKKAMVTLGLTSKMPERLAAIETFTRVLAACRAPRVVGCAGLAMCAVARGAMDVYLVPTLAVWDALAPSVILRGAGGRISDADGEPWQPRTSSVVMSNGRLHDWAVDLLRTALAHADAG